MRKLPRRVGVESMGGFILLASHCIYTFIKNSNKTHFWLKHFFLLLLVLSSDGSFWQATIMLGKALGCSGGNTPVPQGRAYVDEWEKPICKVAGHILWPRRDCSLLIGPVPRCSFSHCCPISSHCQTHLSLLWQNFKLLSKNTLYLHARSPV
jgi:hypothetical protein